MKNSLGFLIIPLLLFSLLLFPAPVNANVSTSATINYNVSSKFETSIDVVLKNSSKSLAVVNYFTIVLPYQNVSDIQLSMPGRNITSTAFKQKNGTEVIINLKNLVIQGRSSDAFRLTFQSINTIDSNWGYAKLKSKIDGLKIDKVTLKYDNSKPDISAITGATLTKLGSGNYEFNSISASTIAMNFGEPVTFKYSFNKTYLNDSDEEIVQEVVLPVTDSTQTLVLDSLSPDPVSQRIDNDNNVILGFKVDPEKQTIVNIQGYIIKKKENNQQGYTDTDLKTEGFWSLTNQFERIRLENYLKEKQLDKNAINISKFVASRFNLSVGNNDGKSSFENALRMGPDTAIGRKDNAIAEDYADLLITLLRENSIPSRMIVGYLPKSHQFISDGAFHSWVEYYDVNQKIWLNLDPSTADLFKSPDYDANNSNTIKLLVRSKHYNLPKLPFITNKDLIIEPSSENITEIFNPELDGNVLRNAGNSVVKVVSGNSTEIVLPKGTLEIKQAGKSVIQSLNGKSKEYDIKAGEVVNKSSEINLLSELVLVLLFFVISTFCLFIYAKIKHVK